MNTLAVRCRSLLLLGLFLLGSLGVPLVDGVLYHLVGKDPCAGLTHVEAQGSTHHADRCTLAQPAAAQREALGSATAVRTAAPESVRTVLATAIAPPATAPLSLQHSRAPPA